MERKWDDLIWPIIRGVDFSSTIDLAAGHGRNSSMLRPLAIQLTIVDINEECIDACRRRFGDDSGVAFVLNDGTSLEGIRDDSASFVYCFDAMVHFAPEVVAAYLFETARVLKAGGHAFFHHSNRPLPPGADFTDALHWRHDMSLRRFSSLAADAGLEVVHSAPIDWSHEDHVWPHLDGLTLLRRP